MVEIGFVLSKSRRSPTVEDILIALHQVGLPATADPPRESGGFGFELSDGSSLIVSFVDAPHPDLRPITTTSRWLGTDLEATASHLVLLLYNPELDETGALDVVLMRCIAAVADATDAVAARAGVGLNYWTIGDFESELNGLGDAPAELPSHLIVGFEIAVLDDARLSILSAGLARYGADELLIHTPKEKKDAALNALWSLADEVRFGGEDADVLVLATEAVSGLSQPPTQIVNPINEDKNVVNIVLEN